MKKPSPAISLSLIQFLTLTHEKDPKWAEFASRTEAGWSKMLGVLAGLVPTR